MCATDFIRTSAEYNLEFDDDLLTIPITDRWNFPMRPREIVGRSREGELNMTMANWGLVPRWASDKKFGRNCYNARDDSIVQGKPAFREAFKHRRCLLLANGFVEYADRVVGNPATEFVFADRRLFAYAGLFETWGEERFLSCAMITTEPNEVVAPYQSRMPVILRPSDYGKWIDPAAHRDDLLALLRPLEDEPMLVGPAVLPPRKG